MSETEKVARLPEETDLAWSAFQTWMAMPRPRRQDILARELGVHPVTVCNWSKEHRWKEREPRKAHEPSLTSARARIAALRKVRRTCMKVFEGAKDKIPAAAAGRLVIAALVAERAEEQAAQAIPVPATSSQQWDLEPLTLSQIRVLEALIAVCGARDDGRPATPEELALLERINALDS